MICIAIVLSNLLSYLSSYSLFIEFDVEAGGFSMLCMRTRVLAATSRFGSRSLQIHIRSCLAKFHQEQSNKEKNERRSRIKNFMKFLQNHRY